MFNIFSATKHVKHHPSTFESGNSIEQNDCNSLNKTEMVITNETDENKDFNLKNSLNDSLMSTTISIDFTTESDSVCTSPIGLKIAEHIDKVPEQKNDKNSPSNSIKYKILDTPPWFLCCILGYQHYLTMMGGTITYPYIFTPRICMKDSDPARGHIASTIFFTSGIGTLLQTTFGSRLPVIQGSTFAHLVPIMSLLSLPQWQCPTDEQIIADRAYDMKWRYVSNYTKFPITYEEREVIWKIRMSEVQGAIIIGSIIECFFGLSGLVGFAMKFITPLTVAPLVSLLGLSLFSEAADSASLCWPISIATFGVVVLFSQYLCDVPIVIPSMLTRGKPKSFELFKLLPVILTIVIMWLTTFVLTATNVFPEGHPTRTDLHAETLAETPWFRVPYPFQWGFPTFSTGAIVGLLAGISVSIVESVGDYHACARLSGAPPPPVFAVSRGIFAEGVGSIISAIFGAGCGLTSYSENIGAIGITKVASRRVIQWGGLIMIFLGMVSKIGAFFVTLPEPIMGGLFLMMFSVVFGVGVQTLQHVDLSSTRNVFIYGAATFMGICIPKWMKAHPGVINTGVAEVDQVLTILTSTSMFVGGALGMLLDNTISGTREERGLISWEQIGESVGKQQTSSAVYDLPLGLDRIFQRFSIFRYLPISSTYLQKREKHQSSSEMS